MNLENPEKTAAEIISFIKSAFSASGFSRAVIGVSGGVDSATSCMLAVNALGKENVYPVLMPYGIITMQATIDAMKFVQGLGISVGQISRVDIKPAVDAIISASGPVDSLRRGNIMARERMTVLFDQAKKRNALVVGTENRSEHMLGYYTRFGDEASDIEPIGHLYKTQVLELAKHLKVPADIISKTPSADLWAGQTDEGELGFTYQDADEILYQYYDLKIPEEKIAGANISAEIVKRVTGRLKTHEFKDKTPYRMTASKSA
jgi:NAD+ synthase